MVVQVEAGGQGVDPASDTTGAAGPGGGSGSAGSQGNASRQLELAAVPQIADGAVVDGVYNGSPSTTQRGALP